MRQLSVRLVTLFLIALLCAPARFRAQDNSAPIKFSDFDAFVEQVMKAWKVPGLAVDDAPALGGTKLTFLINRAGEVDRVAIPLEPNVKEIIFTRRKGNPRDLTSNE